MGDLLKKNLGLLKKADLGFELEELEEDALADDDDDEPEEGAE